MSKIQNQKLKKKFIGNVKNVEMRFIGIRTSK